MKKLFIVILALILLLGLGTMLVNAKAIKVPLFSRPGCTEEAGWVIVNKNAAGEISVEVSLKKVEANADFLVFIKRDSVIGIASWVGGFMTNKAGNGNSHWVIDSEGETWVKVVVRTASQNSNEGYHTCGEICLAEAPIISSENLAGPFTAGSLGFFDVTTVNPLCGQEYSSVLFNYTIFGIDTSKIVSFEYKGGATWYDAPVSQDGSNVTGFFGPSTGFPMGVPYDETTEFRIIINAEGTYPVIITLNDLNNSNAVLATLTEDVVVE